MKSHPPLLTVPQLKHNMYLLKPFGVRGVVELHGCESGSHPRAVLHENGMKSKPKPNCVVVYVNSTTRTIYIQFANSFMYPQQQVETILADLLIFFNRNIRCVLLNNALYSLSAPMIFSTYDEAVRACSTCAYKTFSVIHIYDNVNQHNILQPVHIREIHFDQTHTSMMIEALEQSDHYKIYHNDGAFVDYAFVPDYKTSVMLNKIFRNVPENENVDLIEESDDEGTTETIVNRSRVRMMCAYNSVFSKWMPVGLVS